MRVPSEQESASSRGPAPLDILFVGYGDWHLWNWDGFRTRSAQLCRFLARSDRVGRLFVLNEPIYLRRSQPGFSVPRWDRFRKLPLRGGARRTEEQVVLLDPSRFLAGPDWLKRPYVVRMLRRELEKWKSRPVLWVANVHKAYLMHEIEARMRVFDAIDDWDSVPEYRRYAERIRAGYETVLEHADLIYTVSRHLQEKLRPRARTRQVHQLPNGVDLDLFCEPAQEPSARRTSRKERRPLLTYVGVLSDRFDMDLLARVAGDWPECRIRLIGPVGSDVEKRFETIRRLPNVEWTGLVHHSRIPKFLRDSDVLLIPHKESSLSLSMDPLKLYEYLTTGLPIVATPVPPMEAFSTWVYIGSGDGFSRRVGEALEEPSRADSGLLWQGRIEEGKRHGWGSRVRQIVWDLERVGDIASQRDGGVPD